MTKHMTKLFPDHIVLDLHHGIQSLLNFADTFDYAILEDDMVVIMGIIILLPFERAIREASAFLNNHHFMSFDELKELAKILIDIYNDAKEEVRKCQFDLSNYHVELVTDDFVKLTFNDSE